MPSAANSIVTRSARCWHAQVALRVGRLDGASARVSRRTPGRPPTSASTVGSRSNGGQKATWRIAVRSPGANSASSVPRIDFAAVGGARARELLQQSRQISTTAAPSRRATLSPECSPIQPRTPAATPANRRRGCRETNRPTANSAQHDGQQPIDAAVAQTQADGSGPREQAGRRDARAATARAACRSAPLSAAHEQKHADREQQRQRGHERRQRSPRASPATSSASRHVPSVASMPSVARHEPRPPDVTLPRRLPRRPWPVRLALSVFSQVNSGSLRPKCPPAAVLR